MTDTSRTIEPVFAVVLQDYEALTAAERAGVSHNGHGPEYASYLRVTHEGQTIYLESDAMEPEDASFTRDLKWIKDALLKAYALGVEDGRWGDMEGATEESFRG